MTEIQAYCTDLNARIDASVEDALQDQWQSFLADAYDGEIFSPRRIASSSPTLDWPSVHINDALEDEQLMALSELSVCSHQLAIGSGNVMNVRCNYGTPIMASLFGVQVVGMSREMNTLPACHPLNGADDIKRLLDAGLPDVTGGLGGRVFAMAERFMAIGRQYENIGRYVHLYHPDLQGPMDLLEMVWGSSIFLELMDQPELVHDFLDLCTQTYQAFYDRWCKVTGTEKPATTAHWGVMIKGALMIRDDSAMNLSPEMFETFIKPYDQRLLTANGGGVIHSCGKVDHWVDRLATMSDLSGLNLTQPEYNDMEKVFRHTVDRGLFLYDLPADGVQGAVESGRPLHGRVHVQQWPAD